MNYFVSIFALLIGVSAFWFSIKFIRLYFRVKNWSKIPAVINSKEIVLHPKYSTSRAPYGLKVDYTYSLNGVEYTGHTVYLPELSGGQVNHMKSTAENKLSAISDTMSVYVDPADSKRSVLYCTGVGLYIFVLLMGFMAFLMALSAII